MGTQSVLSKELGQRKAVAELGTQRLHRVAYSMKLTLVAGSTWPMHCMLEPLQRSNQAQGTIGLTY